MLRQAKESSYDFTWIKYKAEIKTAIALLINTLSLMFDLICHLFQLEFCNFTNSNRYTFSLANLLLN